MNSGSESVILQECLGFQKIRLCFIHSSLKVIGETSFLFALLIKTSSVYGQSKLAFAWANQTNRSALFILLIVTDLASPASRRHNLKKQERLCKVILITDLFRHANRTVTCPLKFS